MMGKLKPETPIFDGKNHGFRLRFSQQNQSIDCEVDDPDPGSPPRGPMGLQPTEDLVALSQKLFMASSSWQATTMSRLAAGA